MARRRRTYRRQLGFCYDCLERALPGLLRCPKHQESQLRRNARYRARKAAQRGWVMKRIPVGT